MDIDIDEGVVVGEERALRLLTLFTLSRIALKRGFLITSFCKTLDGLLLAS